MPLCALVLDLGRPCEFYHMGKPPAVDRNVCPRAINRLSALELDESYVNPTGGLQPYHELS
jgi:hypothetical protein